MTTCIVGTRGSALALWQAHAVRDALCAAHPGLDVQIRVIKTTGDRNLAQPLAEIGDKGLFTKELENALVNGEVDLCVHSMKDVPTELAPGCRIAAMLPRADVRDALVCGPRIAADCLADVPEGSRLGTGSLRRTAQLRAKYPNVEPKGIRGNVDTRLAKAAGDDYEGAILASAGITRLGLADRISAYIPIEDMIPAVGQGAVGVEVREDDDCVIDLLKPVNDQATYDCVTAERYVLATLEGGCQVPLGAHMRNVEGSWRMDAIVASVDGSKVARTVREASLETEPIDLAKDVLNDLFAQGAREILAEIASQNGGER